MKVIIPRLELVSLIGKIQNIVPTKPALPVLVNVLIEALDDELILSATDLTVSMRVHTQAKVESEGAIALPARKLFQLIRELTAPQIEIETSSPEVAIINSGSSHFKIQGMHKNEFPELPNLSDGLKFSMTPPQLRDLLARCSFAASREDTQKILSSVLLKHTDQQTIFLSTDGKRLAKITATTDLPQTTEGSFVIPIKAADEMIHMLDTKDQEPVNITLMPGKIALEVQQVVLISKLLAGEFPEVSRVIPQPLATPIALHREELISLLRQVSLFASEKNQAVRFSFIPGELHLSANSGEIGEGRVKMPVNYEGEKLDIAFNGPYFLDLLRHSKDEVVHFSVTSSHAPGLMTDSSTAQFVIMPMRLE